MAGNVYDDAAFHDAYSRLSRSTRGLDGAPEWPALRAMVPVVRDARVLDLGCGFGWFARWARGAGARSVVAIDGSRAMLAGAHERTADSGISYVLGDLESHKLDGGGLSHEHDLRFDLVFSSLTLHYIVDLAGLLARIRAALRPGGHLLFSVEHPIYLAPSVPEWQPGVTPGGSVWPLDGYAMEGPRDAAWLGSIVRKQHRTVASYVNTVLAAGFVLRRLEEWCPSVAQVQAQPAWAIERHRPYFLLVSAQRDDGESAAA